VTELSRNLPRAVGLAAQQRERLLRDGASRTACSTARLYQASPSGLSWPRSRRRTLAAAMTPTTISTCRIFRRSELTAGHLGAGIAEPIPTIEHVTIQRWSTSASWLTTSRRQNASSSSNSDSSCRARAGRGPLCGPHRRARRRRAQDRDAADPRRPRTSRAVEIPHALDQGRGRPSRAGEHPGAAMSHSRRGHRCRSSPACEPAAPSSSAS